MKSKRNLLKFVSFATALFIFIGIFPSVIDAAITRRRVAVHDPSVIKVGSRYYLIGSHLESAYSDDLYSWQYFANGNRPAKDSTLFNDIYTDLAVPGAWSKEFNPTQYDLNGNLWAPDIIWNPHMGKYAMYLSVNGQNWNSSIVLCVSDKIEGPYTYVAPIVYSGFTNGSVNNVSRTDVAKVLGDNPNISRYLNNNGSWNANYGTNAIDPGVFFDEKGKLWMVYGSWFGGLFMLELDKNTGLRDYNVTYSTTTNVSDAYMGKKVAGGYYTSGEGPYIQYMKSPDSGKGYYYLFISYGHFNSNGGYNMRIFRSENPDGPYVDQNGNSAVYTRNQNNIGGNIGQRLMSNYQWSVNNRPFKAQGHNSALVDDDGKFYVIYHTKFDDSNGFHEVRVHQLFINRDDWLVAAPYEYSGETLSKTGHTMTAVSGDYEFIFHTLNQAFVNEVSADVEKPKNITLNPNGTVTGEVTGTWTMENGTPHMSIVIGNVTYKGQFVVMDDESAAQTPRMTFTATGNNTCVWGSKKAAYNSAQDVTTSATTATTTIATTTATTTTVTTTSTSATTTSGTTSTTSATTTSGTTSTTSATTTSDTTSATTSTATTTSTSVTTTSTSATTANTSATTTTTNTPVSTT
ncbi:MAG: glycoside hydrolase family 43 protein, partial [Oscillospiraceae bacterium]|nr:glycoside hydrolase family 43 protein [Oscillospiraceae bacterium]